MSEGLIAGSIVILLLILFLILFMAEYQKRRKQYLNEKVRFQEELLRTQLEIQEQTLKNISQEIHDNIGQTLSLVKLNLNTADLQKPDSLQQKISSSKDLVSKAIADLRNLSKSLNTDSILSAGLIKAIETELIIINHAETFRTELNVSGNPIVIDSKKELILFRIVQEAINNIIKHSNAKMIFVNAVFTSNRLEIQIQDNGSGFDAGEKNNDGSGLRNMSSRAQLIGGSFEIRSGSDGTSITITLPITES